MPIQLNGITGWAGRPGQNGEVTPERSHQTNRGDRVQNLKTQISQNENLDASGTLTQLRGILADRSGYLRLDGAGQDGPVSFSTRWNTNPFRSAKGEVTGAALKALFEKGGYDTTRLNAYLAERGNNSLSITNVRQIIDSAVEFMAAKSAHGAQTLSSDDASQLCAKKKDVFTEEGEHDLSKSMSASQALESTRKGLETLFPDSNPIMLSQGAQGCVYALDVSGNPTVYKKINQKQEITEKQLSEGDLASARLVGSQNIAVPTEYFIQVSKGANSEVIRVRAENVQEWCGKLLGMGADLKMVGLLMPRAAGETIDEQMRRGLFSENAETFKSLAKGLVGGMREMHQNNLVFHDLKPANALMEQNGGTVTLVDLGEIVQLDPQDPKTEKTDKRAGSELFMADRVKKREPHGTEVDYYSLAVTLLVALEPALEKVPPDSVSIRGRAEDLVGNHINALKTYNPEKGAALESALVENPFAQQLITQCFAASSEIGYISENGKHNVQQMVNS